MGEKRVENRTTSSSSQTNSTAAAGAEESGLRAFLIKMAQDAGGQMSGMGDLASGKGLTLTQEDIDLINQAVGGQADISRGALQEQFRGQNAQMAETLGATGANDSSIELMRRLMTSGDQTRALRDVELTRMGTAAQYGMALPYQRAGVQLQANSQLFNQLGVANPVLQSFLQDRLANSTTTASGTGTGTQMNSGFSMADIAAFLPKGV